MQNILKFAKRELALMSNILTGSTNVEYHANKTHLSGSNLKMLLKAPQQFYVERILGQGEQQEERDVFSEGSFVHSLVLEPDQMAHYAVFSGLRKAGAAWEQFKEANKGKTILSMPQVNRCEALAKSALAMPTAIKMLSKGCAEHTMVADILGVLCKARADWINIEDGYILDVKTTAMPSDKDVFAQTVSEYEYALSAALYCQIAYEVYGKLFDFYFLVLSKADKGANIYKASSDLLSFGAARMTTALVLYKQCQQSGIWSLQQPKKDFNNSNYEIEEI